MRQRTTQAADGLPRWSWTVAEIERMATLGLRGLNTTTAPHDHGLPDLGSEVHLTAVTMRENPADATRRQHRLGEGGTTTGPRPACRAARHEGWVGRRSEPARL